MNNNQIRKLKANTQYTNHKIKSKPNQKKDTHQTNKRSTKQAKQIKQPNKRNTKNQTTQNNIVINTKQCSCKVSNQ